MCIGCFFEAKIVSVDFSCPVIFPKYAVRYVGGNNIKINTLMYISVKKQSFTENTKLTKMVYSRETTSEERALIPILSSYKGKYLVEKSRGKHIDHLQP